MRFQLAGANVTPFLDSVIGPLHNPLRKYNFVTESELVYNIKLKLNQINYYESRFFPDRSRRV